MSVNWNIQTNANPQESLYITRQEVIQAISSIGNLSSISLFSSPNPSFSTISMNANGIINGFVPIQTSNVIFQSTSSVGQAANFTPPGATNRIVPIPLLDSSINLCSS